MQAGVKTRDIQEFCTALDFKSLGERAKSARVGLATVMTFLKLTRQAGVKVTDVKDFCVGLDWKELGTDGLDDAMKLRISPLYLFHELLHCEGISYKISRKFIEGIGWVNLRDCMKSDFNPDGLAALRKFLTHKCKYDTKELRQKGLDWSSKTTWFHAFINIPRSTTNENVHVYGQYLKYACNGLLYEDISPLLKSEKMDLKGWNIFIHNMKLAYPDYIQSTIVPILNHFSTTQFENLFIKSDPKNIGIFLDHFKPQDGIFSWNLTSEIGYQKIDFVNIAQQSSLSEIAYFIFNFYYINDAKWCNFFAEKIEENMATFTPVIEASDLKTIEFFVWNWWMACQEGCTPDTLKDGTFLEVIFKKVQKERDIQENVLALLGTLYLAGCEIQESLLKKINPNRAIQICRNALIEERIIKSIRLIGGLIALSSEEHLEWIREEGIPAILKTPFELEVPNQIVAINKLKEYHSNL
jgi:hypothetical protein